MTTPVEGDRNPDLGRSAGVVQAEVVTRAPARITLAMLRIAFGFIFLWAFFDKLLALGLSTGKNPQTGAVDRFGAAAWIHGGSPTQGFLSHGVPENNPFKSFFNGIAGDPWADWLFMIGLLGIGLALFFGFAMRLAGFAGAILYLLMWLASWPVATNPFIDDHLTGAIVVIVLALTLAGDTWGVGRPWARLSLVHRMGFLR